MSIKCITPYCHDSTIQNVTGKPTRTPGFYPDYECLDCGARWIEPPSYTGRTERSGRLRELNEAAKEFHHRQDNAKFEGHVAGGRGGH